MISCISFTANGSRINRRLQDYFLSQGIECEGVALARYAHDAGVTPLEGSYKEWCRERFPVSDTIIFISASGIAVRGIAPFVKDKKTDPAVLVIDEQANFVISLLSGHIGGANEMTLKIAQILGAVPVITTGTDVNHTFAVDVFATKNQLSIESMTLAKEMAAWIIDKKPVWFYSDLPVTGKLPGALTKAEGEEFPEQKTDKEEPHMDLRVTFHEGGEGLRLVPRCVHLGIGCKRDTPYEKIEALVSKVLSEEGIDYKAIVSASSIDLKKDEQGLIEYCRVHGIPFHVYSAEELKETQGAFTPSRFVGSITGVDNVCERAAAFDAIKSRMDAENSSGRRINSPAGNSSLGQPGSLTGNSAVEQPGSPADGQPGASNRVSTAEPMAASADIVSYKENCCRILRRKTALNGVTVAIAIEDRSVRFE